MGFTKLAHTRNTFWAWSNHWVLRHLPLVGVPLAVILVFGVLAVRPVYAAASDTSAITLSTLPISIDAQEQGPRFRWPFVFFGISQYFSGYHPGVDLTNPAGTPIYPITDGVVLEVNAFPDGYGRHVIVKHDDTLTSLYAHMSKVHVVVGQKVDKNTILGEVGATGWATGNHLHLEIRENGVSVNPITTLPKYKIGEVFKTVQVVQSTPGAQIAEKTQSAPVIQTTQVITQAIAAPPIPSLSL